MSKAVDKRGPIVEMSEDLAKEWRGVPLDLLIDDLACAEWSDTPLGKKKIREALVAILGLMHFAGDPNAAFLARAYLIPLKGPLGPDKDGR